MGCPQWMAPEVLRQLFARAAPYGPAVDVYRCPHTHTHTHTHTHLSAGAAPYGPAVDVYRCPGSALSGGGAAGGVRVAGRAGCEEGGRERVSRGGPAAKRGGESACRGAGVSGP